MPKLTHIEHERAIGMLQANMASSVIAQQFRCHVGTIERLRNYFRQTGTTSDCPCLGRPRVTTRRRIGNLIAMMTFQRLIMCVTGEVDVL